MALPAYHYARQDRRPATLILVVIAWLIVLGLALVGAAWPLLLICAAIASWAFVDVLRNARAQLRLDDDGLFFQAGRGTAHQIPLDRIDTVILKRRMDMSTSLRLNVSGSGRVALPPQIAPPYREFAALARARGLTVEERLFF